MTDYGFSFMNPLHRAHSASLGAGAGGATGVAGGPDLAPWLGGGGFSGTTPSITQDKVPEKTDIERQADVVKFLEKRPDRKPASIAEIFEGTGVDLREGEDEAMRAMLQRNPKVDVLDEDDLLKETMYVYVAKYSVRNRQELLQLINRCKGGIPMPDLEDIYRGSKEDIRVMVRGGEVIGIKNNENNNLNLYPRGAVFLTALSGTVEVAAGRKQSAATHDLRGQVRRGEAVLLGDTWYRVSSEIYTDSGDQPIRARAPTSVTSDRDLSARNEYRLTFGPSDGLGGGMVAPGGPKMCLPLSQPCPAGGDFKGTAYRHGCNKRLRELWRETLQQVPEDPAELHQVMFAKGLTSRTAAAVKRPRKRAPDGSTKRELRRQQRRAKRQHKNRYKTVTNTHLQGTELGRLLEETEYNKGAGSGDRGGF